MNWSEGVNERSCWSDVLICFVEGSRGIHPRRNQRLSETDRRGFGDELAWVCVIREELVSEIGADLGEVGKLRY